MKTKLFSVILLVYSMLLFSSCSNDDLSVTGYEKTNSDKSNLLRETQSLFQDSIQTVYEPDYRTVLQKVAQTTPDLNLLLPHWEDSKLSESANSYVLEIPLSGNSVLTASILSQSKTDNPKFNGYKLEMSNKTVNSILVFTKDKETNMISYHVITTFKESSSSKAEVSNNLHDYIIFSDKNGQCSQIMSISSDQQLPVELTTEFSKSKSEPLEFTSLRFVNKDTENEYVYYINNKNSLTEESGKETNKLKSDNIYYCFKHGEIVSSFGAACYLCVTHFCKIHGFYQGSKCSYCNNYGTTYKCGSCGLYLGVNKISCNNCGNKPNKKAPVPLAPNELPKYGSNSGSSSDGSFYNPDVYCDPEHDDYNEAPIVRPSLNDCQKFYKCFNGYAYEFECPYGLHFNPESVLCDYPSNSNCQN